MFHHFHLNWIAEISTALNKGILPKGFFALAEQVVSGPIPDVITLQRGDSRQPIADDAGGIAVAEAPPKARFVTSAHIDPYASKANRIVIRHRWGQVIAVIEIVSPGNKESQHGLRSFVDKAEELLLEGIHLLVVDLFPPSSRDPQGIHKAIWDRIANESFELPKERRLTVVAYSAGETKTAYVEPVAVGDVLPSLPIFLDERTYVKAPLEETYNTTWAKCPDVLREALTA